MALELAVSGMTDVEIARRVGVSRQWEGEDEKARLKTAMYVLKLSGLQGFAKPPKPMSREEQSRQTVLDALAQVAEEMGFGERYL